MFRNFGISLLLFGLLLAGIDGFADRDGTASPNSGVATEETEVHTSQYGVGIPPR